MTFSFVCDNFILMTNRSWLQFIFLNTSSKLGTEAFSWRPYCSPVPHMGAQPERASFHSVILFVDMVTAGNEVLLALMKNECITYCSPYATDFWGSDIKCKQQPASRQNKKWKFFPMHPSHQRAKTWRLPDSRRACVQLQHKNIISTNNCCINMFALLFTKYHRNAL